MAESSSTPVNGDKPVIVWVKRKAFHSTLDVFCKRMGLEIHERPSKRPFLDFGKLSLSDSASSGAGELKTNMILVWHKETVISSEDIFSVLQSFAGTPTASCCTSVWLWNVIQQHPVGVAAGSSHSGDSSSFPPSSWTRPSLEAREGFCGGGSPLVKRSTSCN